MKKKREKEGDMLESRENMQGRPTGGWLYIPSRELRVWGRKLDLRAFLLDLENLGFRWLDLASFWLWTFLVTFVLLFSTVYKFCRICFSKLSCNLYSNSINKRLRANFLIFSCPSLCRISWSSRESGSSGKVWVFRLSSINVNRQCKFRFPHLPFFLSSSKTNGQSL